MHEVPHLKGGERRGQEHPTEGRFAGTSLIVQWLDLHNFTAKGMGSIPGFGTKILKATLHDQKKKKEFATVGKWRARASVSINQLLFLVRKHMDHR